MLLILKYQIRKTVTIPRNFYQGANGTKLCRTSLIFVLQVFSSYYCLKLTFHFQASAGVLQYYEHFINDETVDIIVKETNQYAEQSGNVAGKRKLKGKREWKPVSAHEMHLFLEISVLEGVIKKLEESMYSTKNASIETPFFRTIMLYNRYCEIKKYLHFVSNEAYNPENHPNTKLYKIWPICEHLNKVYENTITPERDITRDEMLMLYKGHLSWHQYIPLKKVKFCIKKNVLSDSSSGYIWSFIIYTEKGTLFHPKFRSLSLPSQVVMTLIMPLLKQGYCITLDNYYTSPELCDILLTYQTDVVGTVRQNKRIYL
ncbi:PiggyBac transposable element-derived protein 4, partial [Stegodyphus mimosarum]